MEILWFAKHLLHSVQKFGSWIGQNGLKKFIATSWIMKNHVTFIYCLLNYQSEAEREVLRKGLAT